MVSKTMVTAEEQLQGELDSVRDTVESIWIAIVVAFVLRAFMFEAFVIPTGSMAPRLYGEHWDLTCPACGYDYAHGLHVQGSPLRGYNRRMLAPPTDARCPNCLYPYSGSEHINSGDRVLVLKYLYTFKEPQPWDVVVFKNPQTNRDNYIKRLIGLPGETIEIVHGDIFVKAEPDAPWRIRRKPASAQRAMWQVVSANDYQPRATWMDQGRSPRWIPDKGPQAWDLDGDGGRVFAFAGGDDPAWLNLDAQRKSFFPLYGYNTSEQERRINHDLDVCSDLKLSFVFTPSDDASKVSLLLSSFTFQYKGELSSDGTVRLWYRRANWPAQQWDNWGIASVGRLKAGRGVEVALVHSDLQVQLWVGGEVVLTNPDDEYPVDHEWLTKRITQARLLRVRTPQVSIAAEGGPFRLTHVTLMRDVYYTSPPRIRDIPDDPTGDYVRQWLSRAGQRHTRPGWGATGWPIHLTKHPEDAELDEFYVLGDNSPASHDGRTWSQASSTLRLRDKQGNLQYHPGTVPRYNLIGRAFFVYWPSGFRLPGLSGLPIVPNAGRMRLVR